MLPFYASVSGSNLISQLLGDIPFAYPAYAILVVIFILFLYRIIRAGVGRRYSYFSVFFTPVLYSVFVLITFIGSPEYEVIIGLTITVFGMVVGGFLSRKVRVFERKNEMYFKASVIITILWTLSFTGKILAMLYFPSLGPLVGTSAFLTLTTGMLVAEAIIIHYRHYRFKPGSYPSA